MRVVAYLRVSTNGQVDRYGLDAQRQAVADWCAAHGHDIVGEEVDRGVSGRLLDRVGLGDALGALRNGDAQAIVVARLDRLARDTIVQETILRDVWRMNGELLSTAEGESNLRDDPDDPSRKLIRTILGAVATYERELLTLRMLQGRRAKKRRGGKGEGSYPFGHDKNGPIEREQRILATVRELRAAGVGWRDVAAHLNELPDHQPRRVPQWTHATAAHLGRKAGIS